MGQITKKSGEESDKSTPASLGNIMAMARTDIRNLDKTFSNFTDIVQIVRIKAMEKRALDAQEKMADVLAHSDAEKDVTKRGLLLQLNYDEECSTEFVDSSEGQYAAVCDLVNAGLVELREPGNVYAITSCGRTVAELVVEKQADLNKLQAIDVAGHTSFISHVRTLWHERHSAERQE